MAPRISTTQLAGQVAQQGAALVTQGEALASILSLLQAGQHSTPAPVVDAVTAKPAVEPAPEPVVETPPSAADQLLAFVADKGLAFAKGGRTYQNADMLKAAVRVLKTGTPEVLAYGDGSILGKRGVSHIAMGRADDGKSVFTQFCYTPSA